MHHREPGCISADPEERRVGERQLAKIADDNIEANGHKAIHQDCVDHELHVVVEDERQQAKQDKQSDQSAFALQAYAPCAKIGR